MKDNNKQSYKTSEWYLRSIAPKKRREAMNYTSHALNADANEYKDRRNFQTAYSPMTVYANYMSAVNSGKKYFNYSRDERFRNVPTILALHQEIDTLEKLDKRMDIADGYVV